MVMMASTMLPLGTEAPDFALPDLDGRIGVAGATETEHGLQHQVEGRQRPRLLLRHGF
jgi:hypothetical protein